jgi:MFS superfamily sulfate permease-like transporter
VAVQTNGFACRFQSDPLLRKCAKNSIRYPVVLAILGFVSLISRPKVEILGNVKGFPGFHSIERHPEALTTPALMLFRFNAPIVFFNAPTSSARCWLLPR